VVLEINLGRFEGGRFGGGGELSRGDVAPEVGGSHYSMVLILIRNGKCHHISSYNANSTPDGKCPQR
jgi:hypothetical protein